MVKGGKMDQKDDSRSERNSKTNNQATRKRKAGRKKSKKQSPKNLGKILAKTVKHLFPDLNKWIQDLPDPRNIEKVYFDQRHIIWCGILLFLLHLKSKRQFGRTTDTQLFLENLKCLSQTTEQEVAHQDTLSYYLEKQPYVHISELPIKMVQSLIRKKVLDSYRFKGAFLIAIDGTGQYVFHKRHCQHCMKKERDGEVLYYYHQILEAKLVTRDGFSISIGTIFIENPHQYVDKQDCETKSFYRLAPLLKKYFPRTPFCLLLDALYLNQKVFDICKEYGWKFMVNFKEGSMKAFYPEAKTLAELSPENSKKITYNETTDPSKKSAQTFQWVNDLPYKEHSLSAIFCLKTEGGTTVPFEYLTNYKVSENNVEQLVNDGGRQRWKIETGFNDQKNGGYGLEHAYSLDPNASKNFYYILQIADLLNQLMVKGSLFVNFVKQMGTLRNLAIKLTEHLRTIIIPANELIEKFQIRFNTS